MVDFPARLEVSNIAVSIDVTSTGDICFVLDTHAWAPGPDEERIEDISLALPLSRDQAFELAVDLIRQLKDN